MYLEIPLVYSKYTKHSYFVRLEQGIIFTLKISPLPLLKIPIWRYFKQTLGEITCYFSRNPPPFLSSTLSHIFFVTSPLPFRAASYQTKPKKFNLLIKFIRSGFCIQFIFPFYFHFSVMLNPVLSFSVLGFTLVDTFRNG